jgi:hypothetical protein
MNDTLERLKALNSRLEEKLSEKKHAGEKETNKPESLPETEMQRQTAGKTVRRPRENDFIDTSVPEKAGNQALLLLKLLRIDTEAEPVRVQNLERLSQLYLKLEIEKKVPDIRDIFIYKAMNISGIGLKEDDFGEIREGKYVQVIAITYEPDKNGKKKAKNISLGYFGKAETLELGRKNEVIEFVLRWRYEKAFQNLEHYRMLLERIRPKNSLF